MKRQVVPRRRSPLALSLLSMTLFATPPLAAQPFGFTSLEPMLRLNLANGSTELMPTGGGAYGLAYSPSGVLYGVVWASDEESFLATMDPEGGTFSVVGVLTGIDGFSGGLTFDAQGRLWLARLQGDLYEIDPATAQATLVAESLLEPGESVAGLTACDDRLLVLANQFQAPSSGRLVILDPALGTGTPLGPASTFLRTSAGDAGLDFDAEGRLWAVLDRFNVIDDPVPIDGISEIDPSTGVVLSSQTVQTVGWSLAISPPPAVCPFVGPSVIEVPTLGQAPLAILATLLGLAGAWALRRRAVRTAR